MDILVLGSGTSHGVPMIGCACEVCRSENPKNQRFRPSILVRHGGKAILVDTTPELRMQALAFDVRQVDAVFFTHTHADHIMGLDDLRRFNDLSGQELPVYGDSETLADIRRIFPYIFRETPVAGGKPRLTLHTMEPEFDLFGLRIHAFTVFHGKLPVLAYRFDAVGEQSEVREAGRSVAYVTDVNSIPPEAMEKLRGLDVLILDAVRFEPHATHFGLYQALDVIAELKPAQAYLTHLSHHFDHEKVNAQLPDNVRLAYDGLVT
jgi:phosphoribosyl 1,2-cyclic phosphate phosphodiesterase